MEQSHTKKSTRIIILIIAFVMTAGFIGSYFIVFVNNPTAQTPDTSSQPAQDKELPVDPTAYKTTGKVTALEKTDLVVGTGEEVLPGDTLLAHYKGTLADSGKKFDSSYDRGEPAQFSLTRVIQGWQEGVPGMKVGGKRRLVIPAELGYGATGTNGIPPNADLVFEVEIIAVLPATQ